MGVDSGALIKTLNPTCLNALQGAAGLCLSRTNPTVEIEHWLFKLAETPNTDLTKVFRHFEVDTCATAGRLDQGSRPVADRQPTDADAVAPGSINFSARPGSWHPSSTRRRRCVRVSCCWRCWTMRNWAVWHVTPRASWRRSRSSLLQPNLMKLVAGSSEDVGPAPRSDAGAGTGAQPAGVSQTPALDQYTVNLTGRAKNGEIDPVIGREPEVRQMVDILIRRRQNNPILTGEAGVGKTAVVEGLALRIAQGDVPEVLKNVVIRTLDLGLLQAGAGVKGEFENRLKQVIAEVKGSPVPVILFIDEAHTMIGAGGQAGQSDAANLLKPALAPWRAPHDRRHDLGRIQEVLRKGRGAGATVPGRQGRGTRRGPRHADDAWDHRDAGEASRGPNPG